MQLKTFTCTVTVADFSIYFVHNIIIYKFLNALSQQTTFAWPITIDYSYMHCCKKMFRKNYSIHNLCMHYWILQLLASLLQTKHCMQQWHLQLFQVLWQLLIYIGTIAINYFCMPYFNSQLLYASLLFTAFVCAIVNTKLFMQFKTPFVCTARTENAFAAILQLYAI